MVFCNSWNIGVKYTRVLISRPQTYVSNAMLSFLVDFTIQILEQFGLMSFKLLTIFPISHPRSLSFSLLQQAAIVFASPSSKWVMTFWISFFLSWRLASCQSYRLIDRSKMCKSWLLLFNFVCSFERALNSGINGKKSCIVLICNWKTFLFGNSCLLTAPLRKVQFNYKRKKKNATTALILSNDWECWFLSNTPKKLLLPTAIHSSYRTNPVTVSELENLLNEILEPHKVRHFPNFQAQKLRKGSIGFAMFRFFFIILNGLYSSRF